MVGGGAEVPRWPRLAIVAPAVRTNHQTTNGRHRARETFNCDVISPGSADQLDPVGGSGTCVPSQVNGPASLTGLGRWKAEARQLRAELQIANRHISISHSGT